MTQPFSVVFLAGGVGSRMKSLVPKQYLPIDQKPLALYSFEIFTTLSEVKNLVVVCEKEYENFFKEANQNLHLQIKFAQPGKRRQDSVWNGLQLIEDNPLVCIHDAARPLITHQMVHEVVQAAEKWEAAVLGVRLRSTVKICDEERIIKKTLDRDFLWEMQTPQVIRLDLLKAGFAYAQEHQLTVTDDVSLVELLGKPVKVVEGSYSNIKATTRQDLIFIEQLQKNALL